MWGENTPPFKTRAPTSAENYKCMEKIVSRQRGICRDKKKRYRKKTKEQGKRMEWKDKVVIWT